MTDASAAPEPASPAWAPDRALDNPVWSALTGPQSAVAERVGRAARYAAEISVFAALDDDPDEAAWRDAARLAGSHLMVLVAAPPPPPGWDVRLGVPALQMLAVDLEVAPDPEAVALGPDDAGDVLALVGRTEPGPFLRRTIELGNYIGIRRDGVLVAMAGERIRVPGWTEISAVGTDESVRGSGLASRLVRAVTAGIRDRGDEALLHVASTNTNAIRLYRTLGFVERRPIEFAVVRAPGQTALRPLLADRPSETLAPTGEPTAHTPGTRRAPVVERMVP
jgi:ribosomal protein S18 acetylase RimI-like enzyme